MREKPKRDRSGHKMVSLKPETWEKIETIAEIEGVTRSAAIALAIGCLWREGRYRQKDWKTGG